MRKAGVGSPFTTAVQRTCADGFVTATFIATHQSVGPSSRLGRSKKPGYAVVVNAKGPVSEAVKAPAFQIVAQYSLYDVLAVSVAGIVNKPTPSSAYRMAELPEAGS